MATAKNAQAATSGETSAANAETDTTTTTASTRGLAVSSMRDGFRRAGLVWNRKPQTVKLSSLKAEQIRQIKSCPGLSVTEVDIPPAPVANDDKTEESKV